MAHLYLADLSAAYRVAMQDGQRIRQNIFADEVKPFAVKDRDPEETKPRSTLSIGTIKVLSYLFPKDVHKQPKRDHGTQTQSARNVNPQWTTC